MVGDVAQPLFLCDEMLVRLGKWLRVAGYDADIATAGIPDRALLAQAKREGRILLTRDRKIPDMKGAGDTVLLLDGNTMDAWLSQMADEVHPDWLYRPFSRCLRCNVALKSGAAEGACLPSYVQTEHHAVYHCSCCGQSYWHGGHVRRMRRQLERWHAMYSP